MKAIGKWYARFSLANNRPLTRAHLIESEIEDRLITRCGRQMWTSARGGVLSEDKEWVGKCFKCEDWTARPAADGPDSGA